MKKVMTKLILIRPNPPTNGFSNGPQQTNRCTSRRKVSGHWEIKSSIDKELEKYSLREMQEIVQDLLDMIQNARVRSRTDHEVLVSAAMLIEMLIEEGISRNLLSPDQIFELPRKSRSINFKPLKNPLQEVMTILGLLLRVLFDQGKRHTTTVSSFEENRLQNYRNPAYIKKCLNLIDHNKALWNITFHIEEFNRRVNNFFEPSELPGKSY